MRSSGSAGAVRQRAPELLGHERHHRDAAAAGTCRAPRRASTTSPRGPSRSGARRPGEPWRARGPSRSTRSRSLRRRCGSPRRTRSRPAPRPRPRSPRRPARGASARPVRDRPRVGQPSLGVGRDPRRAGRRATNRVAFQSLLAKLRACSSSTVAEPLVVARASSPWMTANRSASAPVSSMTPSGSTTLPFVFDIFWPSGSRIRPDR